MITNYINNLKTKPEQVRKRFALTVSLAVTGLILIGWIASYSITSTPTVSDATDAPVSSLTASVGSIYSDIKNMIFGSNKAEFGTIEVTPGNR
jgi:phospholipase/lecithinase/hemolysin